MWFWERGCLVNKPCWALKLFASLLELIFHYFLSEFICSKDNFLLAVNDYFGMELVENVRLSLLVFPEIILEIYIALVVHCNAKIISNTPRSSGYKMGIFAEFLLIPLKTNWQLGTACAFWFSLTKTYIEDVYILENLCFLFERLTICSILSANHGMRLFNIKFGGYDKIRYSDLKPLQRLLLCGKDFEKCTVRCFMWVCTNILGMGWCTFLLPVVWNSCHHFMHGWRTY